MHVTVLGAGIIGISTAWYLRTAGFEVTVIERRSEAALETTFANGGQLSTGHVEPWATPETLPQILEWRHHENSPLLFRLQADPHQWSWGLRFLRECRPQRSAHNFHQLLNLGQYSRAAFHALRAEVNLDYEGLDRGILNLYDSPASLARGEKAAARVNALGYERRPISMTDAIALEPALAQALPHWYGATYTPGDGSGNARLWTQGLARLCAARGVHFQYQTTVTGFEATARRIQGLWLQQESTPRLQGVDAVVVALGSESAPLLRPIGLNLPIYPVKGYSITMPLCHPENSLQVSITDDAHKIVFTRLGNDLRVAGTAEFSGYDHGLNCTRLEALVQRARQLFPHLADYSQVTPWTGLRPATPSNCPLIGPTRWENLFLNTGHGTLGWTLGTGSGKALVELMQGHTPELEFDFTRPA
nr:D-amino acid dehydrogenase [Ferrovum sp.]